MKKHLICGISALALIGSAGVVYAEEITFNLGPITEIADSDAYLAAGAVKHNKATTPTTNEHAGYKTYDIDGAQWTVIGATLCEDKGVCTCASCSGPKTATYNGAIDLKLPLDENYADLKIVPETYPTATSFGVAEPQKATVAWLKATRDAAMAQGVSESKYGAFLTAALKRDGLFTATSSSQRITLRKSVTTPVEIRRVKNSTMTQADADITASLNETLTNAADRRVAG